MHTSNADDGLYETSNFSTPPNVRRAHTLVQLYKGSDLTTASMGGLASYGIQKEVNGKRPRVADGLGAAEHEWNNTMLKESP